MCDGRRWTLTANQFPIDDASVFSEMAMYVLVRRDGKWWLACGPEHAHSPETVGGWVPFCLSVSDNSVRCATAFVRSDNSLPPSACDHIPVRHSCLCLPIRQRSSQQRG